MHMEYKQRKQNIGKEGYILPLVLVAALIGVLFGFGRLMMFRFQTQIRLDRQFEIDRVLATRSGMHWLRYTSQHDYDPPTNATTFTYITGNRRIVGVEVRPVDPIYPADPNDLDLQKGKTQGLENVILWSTDDSMEPEFIERVSDLGTHQVRIGSSGTNSIGHLGRIEIDMETKSWLNDPFGRRYWTIPGNVNFERAPGATGDIFRLILTPFGQSFEDCDAAIWIEQAPVGNNDEQTIVLHYKYNGNHYVSNHDMRSDYVHGKGMQLAGSKATLFAWRQPGGPHGSYTFAETYDLPSELISSFTNASANLRLTLEVEARNPDEQDDPDDKENTFQLLRVDRPFEYEVLLSWSENGAPDQEWSEIATYVHFSPSYFGSVIERFNTYDTHGTERR
jgi:hypothetical protein